MLLCSTLLFTMTAVAADWSDTIDQVVGSVIVLRYENTRAFDGTSASTPQASGFIVDAERGILLSNRHVVGRAPQIAHGIFPNQEEIRLQPIYSDPVHDFGFYRYDPAEVELNDPVSLRLSPEGARMGAEIRLIGNDAGEQISILDGTISRIDRPAPWWDMNTFYVQAASDSSGGSSGSPVFIENGHVVALNAGGRRSESTSYYLRLERVKRALELLQQGEIPSRGTVMTTFIYRPYDELERLGLSQEGEKKARELWDGTGMLVVQTIGVGSPAEGKLQSGDILLEVGGAPVFEFATLESRWDDAVGEDLPVVVERGGERVEVTLTVADLHQLQPDSFLTFAHDAFHEVPYWEAIRNNRPVAGVVVAARGELMRAASIPKGAVIEAIGDRPIASLDDLQDTLTAMKLGEVTAVTYSRMNKPNTTEVARIRMQTSAAVNERCHRSESTTDTRWSCEEITHPSEQAALQPTEVVRLEVQHKRARAMAERLVLVRGSSALQLNTMSSTDFTSAGLVVDAERGVVVTDRWAVGSETSVVTIEAGDSGRVPARVVYLDPLRNIAVLHYDPTLLDFGALKPLVWSTEPPERDGQYWTAQINRDGEVFSEERAFSRFDEVSLSAHRYPKYRADNLSTLRFGKLDRPTEGGVVVDKKGRVVALYQSFRDEDNRGNTQDRMWAVPTWPARDALAGRVPLYAGLDLHRVSMTEAREAGVPDAVLASLRDHRPYDPVVMEVWRSNPGVTPEVRAGDFLIGVDDQPVAIFADYQQALREGSMLHLIRNGQPLTVAAKTQDLTTQQSQRAVIWAGAIVQDEHPEVSRESGTPPIGVYISWHYAGTPARRYGMTYGQRILAVNGIPIEGLDSFIETVSELEDGEPVRLQMQTLQGRELALSLRLDTTWWPTRVLGQTEDGWRPE
jgi:S1-C subfamily serine protease